MIICFFANNQDKLNGLTLSLVIKKNTVDNDDHKDDETDNDDDGTVDDGDDDDGTVDDGGGKSAVYADGRYQAFEAPAKESKMVPRGSSQSNLYQSPVHHFESSIMHNETQCHTLPSPSAKKQKIRFITAHQL